VQVEDSVAQLLDDSIVMAQSMGFSPFKAPFAERIAAWDAKLRLASDVLEAWMAVQRGWMYLEPIFASADIAAQLPLEAKRFATVDRAWRKAADGAARAPTLLAAANPRLLDTLQESARLLDGVQKGLATYLELKRAGFARLFFLSNDELLAVLSQVRACMLFFLLITRSSPCMHVLWLPCLVRMCCPSELLQGLRPELRSLPGCRGVHAAWPCGACEPCPQHACCGEMRTAAERLQRIAMQRCMTEWHARLVAAAMHEHIASGSSNVRRGPLVRGPSLGAPRACCTPRPLPAALCRC
jgi:hypothetical protein